jgi:hypothetical protein
MNIVAMNSVDNDFIDFVVGGVRFTIRKRDIEKYPENYLSAAVNWEGLGGHAPIAIDRDGELFQYVYAYIISGYLSKDAKSGNDKVLLESIRQEAEFFNLPELAKECSCAGVIIPLRTYKTIRDFIGNSRRGGVAVDHPMGTATALLKALGTMWAPFCVKGTFHIDTSRDECFFGSSTVRTLNTAELIAAATPSCFGRGTDTVLDANVRDSLEISADKLKLTWRTGLSGLEEQLNYYIKELCPNRPVLARLYKLVIYQKGGHFDQHRDTVRGDGHIGTVVAILNSEYTGGELEITHGDKTEVVTGPYNWVAVYGDCLHKINPVTSGTRVSLIYDIYARESVKDTSTVFEEEDDEPMERDSFWDKHCYEMVSKCDETKARGVDAVAIRDAVAEELQKLDSVVICLQHMYPASQAVPGFLKGADAMLHEVLQDHYEVQVVYCSIYRQAPYERYESEDHVRGRLFSSFEASDATATNTAEAGRTKLVIPSPLNPDRILDYIPFAEHTGNESQAEETVYVVTGLQVRRKEWTVGNTGG